MRGRPQQSAVDGLSEIIGKLRSKTHRKHKRKTVRQERKIHLENRGKKNKERTGTSVRFWQLELVRSAGKTVTHLPLGARAESRKAEFAQIGHAA